VVLQVVDLLIERLALPEWIFPVSPTWSPFSRLRAAEVLESMGDRARATESYRMALGAWVGADAGFAPKARAEAGLGRAGG